MNNESYKECVIYKYLKALNFDPNKGECLGMVKSFDSETRIYTRDPICQNCPFRPISERDAKFPEI